MVLHKLLIIYTNKPESKGHLQNEEITYRDEAIKESKKYNWNEKDKEELKLIAIAFIKNKKENKYADVKFSISETEKLVTEEIENLKL